MIQTALPDIIRDLTEHLLSWVGLNRPQSVTNVFLLRTAAADIVVLGLDLGFNRTLRKAFTL